MTWVGDGALRGLRSLASDVGVGAVLADRWELGAVIGEGGMGTVFAAHDRELDREVAVKVVRGYSAARGRDDARFSREVELLQRARHPAVVPILTHGEDGGHRFIVMERIRGVSLAEKLHDGALGPQRARSLGLRVAGALAMLHRGGIVHRDVKPANVILPEGTIEEAFLVDFGIARALDTTALTRTGALVGTPGYTAPEQVRGARDVAPAADVFSLGCVLYETLTGRAAFCGEDEAQIHAQVLAETPAMDRLPAAFVGLVTRMLEKDPAQRPTAAAVEIALEALDVTNVTELAPGIVVGAKIAGKYEAFAALGAGGMGVVLAATHVDLGTRVAIKVLLSDDRDGRSRFLREARAASRLESEHVARVLDVGELGDGRPFMVMEHLRGMDLAQRLVEKGPFGVGEAVRCILETCEAIAEAHALGIIHRDLKPSNLFLVNRRDGSELVKVLDFGISKMLQPLEDVTRPETMTDPHVVVGSIPYMAPEQLHGSSAVDARTDVWALGVVLYELLTGVRPFVGASAAEVAARIAASPPKAISEERAVPPALVSVIERCLEKDPARRHPDLGALVRALAPFAPEAAAVTRSRVEGLLGGGEVAPEASVPPRSVAVRDAETDVASGAASRALAVPWGWIVAGLVAAGALGFVATRPAAPPLERPPNIPSGPPRTAAAPSSPVLPVPSPSASAAPASSASSLVTVSPSATARPTRSLVNTVATTTKSVAPPPVRPKPADLDLRDPSLETR